MAEQTRLDGTVASLRYMNFGAAGLHAFLNFLVPVCLLTGNVFEIKDSSRSMSTELVYTNVALGKSGVPVVDHSDYTVIVLLFLFAAVTAIFHLIIAGKAKQGKAASAYGGYIEKENNPLRWLEYGITSTIMIAVIAFSVGLRDFAMFATLCVLNILMNVTGQVAESLDHSAKGSDGTAAVKTSSNLVVLLGWALWLVIWGTLTAQFVAVVSEGADRVPAFVWVAFSGMVTLFSGFGFVHLYKHRNPNASYAKVERAYIVLSFVAKTLLIWLLLGGAFARSGGDE